MKFCSVAFVVAVLFTCSVYAQIGDCPEHQEWRNYGDVCESQCNSYPGARCPAIIQYENIPKCVCKEGYLLIADNKCAPEHSAECGGRYTKTPMAIKGAAV